jgi:hypothetical protein
MKWRVSGRGRGRGLRRITAQGLKAGFELKRESRVFFEWTRIDRYSLAGCQIRRRFSGSISLERTLATLWESDTPHFCAFDHTLCLLPPPYPPGVAMNDEGQSSTSPSAQRPKPVRSSTAGTVRARGNSPPPDGPSDGRPPTKRARKAINCEPCRNSKLKCDRCVSCFCLPQVRVLIDHPRQQPALLVLCSARWVNPS